MKEMTSAERFARMFEHKEADRVPVIDSPWKATIERWVREGMPENVSFVDYFGLDRTDCIVTDNSPRYPTRVVSETEDTIVEVPSWGVTLKNFKHAASTPEYLDFTIVSPRNLGEGQGPHSTGSCPHQLGLHQGQLCAMEEGGILG